jgi:ADP-ribose pyrophosphatase YjhB (NUDIX family)
MSDQYCNNCGKQGHLYNQCKTPITSNGVISYRINNNIIEYLMIRRRHTLGYIDFMRGKYSINDKFYIVNMINQMTLEEKHKLLTLSFEELWADIWGLETVSTQYKTEENSSKEKLLNLKTGINNSKQVYTLHDLVQLSNKDYMWGEAEWGFPKGRRNFKERDYDCAIREYCEETGYKKDHLNILQNISPFEEIFSGSNYKSYKHKYFIGYIPYNKTSNIDKYEKTEVSQMGWFNINDCLLKIRDYNEEKKKILCKINVLLENFQILKV